jgi:hypothetical protein
MNNIYTGSTWPEFEIEFAINCKLGGNLMSTSTPNTAHNSQSQMPLSEPVQKIVDQWVNQINFVLQHAEGLKERHIDDAAANINNLHIKQKEYELFKAKVQAGGYIHKLRTELKKIEISWKDVEREVCDRVGRKPRSLATYRELYSANLNDKYFYKNLTDISQYVAGIRSVTIDGTIDINKALDMIDCVHMSRDEQTLAGKKAGLKVLFETKTIEAGKHDKVNFEAINKVIDSAKDGFDPASIFIQFIDVPVEKWDDLVTKKVLSGHDKIKYDQKESFITNL